MDTQENEESEDNRQLNDTIQDPSNEDFKQEIEAQMQEIADNEVNGDDQSDVPAQMSASQKEVADDKVTTRLITVSAILQDELQQCNNGEDAAGKVAKGPASLETNLGTTQCSSPAPQLDQNVVCQGAYPQYVARNNDVQQPANTISGPQGAQKSLSPEMLELIRIKIEQQHQQFMQMQRDLIGDEADAKDAKDKKTPQVRRRLTRSKQKTAEKKEEEKQATKKKKKKGNRGGKKKKGGKLNKKRRRVSKKQGEEDQVAANTLGAVARIIQGRKGKATKGVGANLDNENDLVHSQSSLNEEVQQQQQQVQVEQVAPAALAKEENKQEPQHEEPQHEEPQPKEQQQQDQQQQQQEQEPVDSVIEYTGSSQDEEIEREEGGERYLEPEDEQEYEYESSDEQEQEEEGEGKVEMAPPSQSQTQSLTSSNQSSQSSKPKRSNASSQQPIDKKALISSINLKIRSFAALQEQEVNMEEMDKQQAKADILDSLVNELEDMEPTDYLDQYKLLIKSMPQRPPDASPSIWKPADQKINRILGWKYLLDVDIHLAGGEKDIDAGDNNDRPPQQSIFISPTEFRARLLKYPDFTFEAARLYICFLTSEQQAGQPIKYFLGNQSSVGGQQNDQDNSSSTYTTEPWEDYIDKMKDPRERQNLQVFFMTQVEPYLRNVSKREKRRLGEKTRSTVLIEDDYDFFAIEFEDDKHAQTQQEKEELWAEQKLSHQISYKLVTKISIPLSESYIYPSIPHNSSSSTSVPFQTKDDHMCEVKMRGREGRGTWFSGSQSQDTKDCLVHAINNYLGKPYFSSLAQYMAVERLMTHQSQASSSRQQASQGLSIEGHSFRVISEDKPYEFKPVSIVEGEILIQMQLHNITLTQLASQNKCDTVLLDLTIASTSDDPLCISSDSHAIVLKRDTSPALNSDNTAADGERWYYLDACSHYVWTNCTSFRQVPPSLQAKIRRIDEHLFLKSCRKVTLYELVPAKDLPNTTGRSQLQSSTLKKNVRAQRLANYQKAMQLHAAPQPSQQVTPGAVGATDTSNLQYEQDYNAVTNEKYGAKDDYYDEEQDYDSELYCDELDEELAEEEDAEEEEEEEEEDACSDSSTIVRIVIPPHLMTGSTSQISPPQPQALPFPHDDDDDATMKTYDKEDLKARGSMYHVNEGTNFADDDDDDDEKAEKIIPLKRKGHYKKTATLFSSTKSRSRPARRALEMQKLEKQQEQILQGGSSSNAPPAQKDSSEVPQHEQPAQSQPFHQISQQQLQQEQDQPISLTVDLEYLLINQDYDEILKRINSNPYGNIWQQLHPLAVRLDVWDAFCVQYHVDREAAIQLWCRLRGIGQYSPFNQVAKQSHQPQQKRR